MLLLAAVDQLLQKNKPLVMFETFRNYYLKMASYVRRILVVSLSEVDHEIFRSALS